MKKILYSIILSLFFVISPVYSATTIPVEALTSFDSTMPAKTMKVAILERIEFENGVVFENGSVVTGDIIDVKQPTRGKRNASFKFQPTSSYYNGKTTKILDSDFIAKYKEKKPLNKGELALSGVTTAGGMLFNIPFLSQGVSLIKGMVKNEKGNRLKSGAVQVYKDSPVAYIEEGKDVIINKNDVFYLRFKVKESDNLDEDVSAENENDTSLNSSSEDKVNEVLINNSKVDENHENLKVNFGSANSDDGSVSSKSNSLQISEPEEVLLEVENSLKLSN